jgi:hypothetical protein
LPISKRKAQVRLGRWGRLGLLFVPYSLCAENTCGVRDHFTGTTVWTFPPPAIINFSVVHIYLTLVEYEYDFSTTEWTWFVFGHFALLVWFRALYPESLTYTVML